MCFEVLGFGVLGSEAPIIFLSGIFSALGSRAVRIPGLRVRRMSTAALL